MNSTGLAKLLPVIFLFLMSVSHCQTLRNTLHLHSPRFPHILLPVQLPPMVCNSMCFSKNVSVWIEHAMCFLAWRASVYLIPWLTSGCLPEKRPGAVRDRWDVQLKRCKEDAVLIEQFKDKGHQWCIWSTLFIWVPTTFQVLKIWAHLRKKNQEDQSIHFFATL